MADIHLFPNKESQIDPHRAHLQAILDEGLRFNQPQVPGLDPLIVRVVLEAASPAMTEAVSQLCSRLIEAAVACERENRH